MTEQDIIDLADSGIKAKALRGAVHAVLEGYISLAAPPTITSAAVDHDMNILLTLSEAMDTGATLPPAEVFTVSGAAENPQVIDLNYDDAVTLHLTLDAAIMSPDLPSLNYERGVTAPILSDAGGVLADFTDLTVTL